MWLIVYYNNCANVDGLSRIRLLLHGGGAVNTVEGVLPVILSCILVDINIRLNTSLLSMSTWARQTVKVEYIINPVLFTLGFSMVALILLKMKSVFQLFFLVHLSLQSVGIIYYSWFSRRMHDQLPELSLPWRWFLCDCLLRLFHFPWPSFIVDMVVFKTCFYSYSCANHHSC